MVARIIGHLPFAWLRSLLAALVAATHEIASVPRLLAAMLLSTVIWALSYAGAILCFIAAAGPISLTPVQVLIVFVFATAGFAVAIAPGGLGTYEAAVIISLGMFG